jgi:hypothetical protein
MLRSNYLKKYKEKNPMEIEEKYIKEDDNYIINSYRPLSDKDISNIPKEKLNKVVDDILNNKNISKLIFSSNAKAEIKLLKKGHDSMKRNIIKLGKNDLNTDPSDIFMKRKKMEAISQIEKEATVYKHEKQLLKESLEITNDEFFKRILEEKEANKINNILSQNQIRIQRFNEIFDCLIEKIKAFKNKQVDKNPKIEPTHQREPSKTTEPPKNLAFIITNELSKALIKEDNHTSNNLNTLSPTSHPTSNNLRQTSNNLISINDKLKSNLKLSSNLGNFSSIETNKGEEKKLTNMIFSTKPGLSTIKSTNFKTSQNFNSTTKYNVTYSSNNEAKYYAMMKKKMMSTEKTASPIKIELPSIVPNAENVYSRLFNNLVFKPKIDSTSKIHQLSEKEYKQFEEKNKLKITDFTINSLIGADGKEFTMKITDEMKLMSLSSLSTGPKQRPLTSKVSSYNNITTHSK